MLVVNIRTSIVVRLIFWPYGKYLKLILPETIITYQQSPVPQDVQLVYTNPR